MKRCLCELTLRTLFPASPNERAGMNDRWFCSCCGDAPPAPLPFTGATRLFGHAGEGCTRRGKSVLLFKQSSPAMKIRRDEFWTLPLTELTVQLVIYRLLGFLKLGRLYRNEYSVPCFTSIKCVALQMINFRCWPSSP